VTSAEPGFRHPQDRPDGAGGDPDPEPDQLTLDPPIPPARILARQLHHQLTHLDRRLRTAGATVRIHPPARHQLPMPAHQRRRSHKERRPHSPRQHAAEHSQHSAITRAKLWTPDLALKRAQLVTQDEDLDLLLALRPNPQDKQLQQPPQHPIEKRQHNAPRTTHLDRRAYTRNAGQRPGITRRISPARDLGFRHSHGAR
jgi:hypothetical protein